MVFGTVDVYIGWFVLRHRWAVVDERSTTLPDSCERQVTRKEKKWNIPKAEN